MAPDTRVEDQPSLAEVVRKYYSQAVALTTVLAQVKAGLVAGPMP